MRVVPLAPTPNQAFTVTLNGVRWGLRIISGRGVSACDVERDGVSLLTGARVLAGEPLIPYAYMQTGNFIFITRNDELPEYPAFGFSQFLVYLDADEIASIKPITYGDIAATVQPEYLINDSGFYLTTDDGALLTNE